MLLTKARAPKIAARTKVPAPRLKIKFDKDGVILNVNYFLIEFTCYI